MPELSSAEDWVAVLRKLPTEDVERQIAAPRGEALRCHLNWFYIVNEIDDHIMSCGDLVPPDLYCGRKLIHIDDPESAFLFDDYWPTPKVGEDYNLDALILQPKPEYIKLLTVVHYLKGAVITPGVVADLLIENSGLLQDVRKVIRAIDLHLACLSRLWFDPEILGDDNKSRDLKVKFYLLRENISKTSRSHEIALDEMRQWLLEQHHLLQNQGVIDTENPNGSDSDSESE